MNLEWKLKAAWQLMLANGHKRYSETTPEEARKQEEMPDSFFTDAVFGKKIDLPKIEDIVMTSRSGDISARVYWPSTEKDLDVLIFFHGGGFVVCSIETHDNVCRRIAKESGRLVFSVDYRLAPEHRFPAGVEDCYDAVVWISEMASRFGGRTDDLAVAGDSAGGNLATVVSLIAKEQGGPQISKQVLIYPAVDASTTYPSETTYRDAPVLSKEDINAFRRYYLNSDDEVMNPHCSPILADLDGMPEALVLTAEYDPLRDQAAAYAQKLKKQGVKTIYRNYPRQVHGFFNFPPMSGQADRAYADVASFLNTAKP